ncbi:hypothetical protein H6228_002518 [Enterococcus faecalis]|nr:hypothetical protein [Enterococcus faecalis]EGO5076977.1 hypothetical protein [Enterococcus faecalis]
MVGEEQTLHHLLCTVLTNTYEDATPYLDFTVSIVPKELKSKQGQYVPNDRKIELFTLTQSPEATVLTMLRELTRHVLFMDEGELKQKDAFYERFFLLVSTAMAMDLLTEDTLLVYAVKEYDQLVERFGEVSSWELPNQTTKNGFTVHVTNSYEARMLLKNRSYRYFTLGKAWEKEFSTKQEAEQEAAFLKQQFPMIQISVLRPVEALLCMHYYIGVSGGFHCKQALYQAGYIWQGYGRKREWVKKVPVSQYNEELSFLHELRLIGQRFTPTFGSERQEKKQQAKQLKRNKRKVSY